MVSTIGEDTWTPIRYPEAFADPDTGGLVSDTEVAETGYTAFGTATGSGISVA
ncbi:hypothetical protein AB0K51_31450 [Kitasatospora sp. NPDC049285]|uniref:hypothetical protein n=1 Tax=Kitasatospora sp. NPDC049285 TaxID=3157096 RepID=UPI00342FEF8E